MLNGEKQGGVFSPVLFCIYLDGLLCRLAESKIGCFIGNVFVGALAYADDIALLAPTIIIIINKHFYVHSVDLLM